MLDVILLGTSGTMPLPKRHLTSLFIKYNGHGILIDCGEGTQVALKSHGISCYDISHICLTHSHADHILGLPGLFLSMAMSNKTETVTIICPKDTKRFVNILLSSIPKLPFEIKFITPNDVSSIEIFPNMILNIMKLKHSVTCFGYSIQLNRLEKFNPEAAKQLNIPIKYWNDIQHNVYDKNCPFWSSLDFNELRNKIMGDKRTGLKITYCTDTAYLPAIADFAINSDMFICEGMYGDMNKDAMADKKEHMMMQDAAKIAKQANVKQLWLTHHSPSMMNPWIYADEIQKIFSNTTIFSPRDTIEMYHKELKFIEN